METNIIYDKDSKIPSQITLIAKGEDDRIFIARLWKAMMFGDEVIIDNGDTTALAYNSGADESTAEKVITEDIPKAKPSPEAKI